MNLDSDYLIPNWNSILNDLNFKTNSIFYPLSIYSNKISNTNNDNNTLYNTFTSISIPPKIVSDYDGTLYAKNNDIKLNSNCGLLNHNNINNNIDTDHYENIYLKIVSIHNDKILIVNGDLPTKLITTSFDDTITSFNISKNDYDIIYTGYLYNTKNSSKLNTCIVLKINHKLLNLDNCDNYEWVEISDFINNTNEINKTIIFRGINSRIRYVILPEWYLNNSITKKLNIMKYNDVKYDEIKGLDYDFQFDENEIPFFIAGPSAMNRKKLWEFLTNTDKIFSKRICLIDPINDKFYDDTCDQNPNIMRDLEKWHLDNTHTIVFIPQGLYPKMTLDEISYLIKNNNNNNNFGILCENNFDHFNKIFDDHNKKLSEDEIKIKENHMYMYDDYDDVLEYMILQM